MSPSMLACPEKFPKLSDLGKSLETGGVCSLSIYSALVNEKLSLVVVAAPPRVHLFPIIKIRTQQNLSNAPVSRLIEIISFRLLRYLGPLAGQWEIKYHGLGMQG